MDIWSQIGELEEAVEKQMAPVRKLEDRLKGLRIMESLMLKPRRPSSAVRKTNTVYTAAATGISDEQAVINAKQETEIVRLKLQQAHQQEQIDSINAEVSTHRVYSFIDWRDKYLKIGFSRKFKKANSGRHATHTRNGLEYLDDRYGTQEQEEALKQLLKTLNKQHGDGRFTPRTGTDEQFKISRELIDILVAQKWPLGEGNPYRLLDDHRQKDLGL